MKILFTCVGRRIELIECFKNAAKKLGINLEIQGTDVSQTAPAFQFCNKTHIVPYVKEESYVPFLLEICKREKIDALIPTVDDDLVLLAINKSKFNEFGTTVFVGSVETVEICEDKIKTAEFFERIGISYPRVFDNVNDYDCGYPYFIKPVDGGASEFAYKVNNNDELELYTRIVPNYIVQPFIDGVEYTVDVLCDCKGNIVYLTPRIRLAVRAGEVLKTRISYDESIIKDVKHIVKNLNVSGQITLQLIKERNTGRNYFIEINARFGGGAPLSIKAGADSAEGILRILNGEELSYKEMAAEDGATFCRYDQSVRVD